MAATRKMFRARVTVDGKRMRVDAAVPIVVGVTEAARILGVPKSNISRLRAQGRMPEPVPQEGPGAPVWLKSEVVELAVTLAAERDARHNRADHAAAAAAPVAEPV